MLELIFQATGGGELWDELNETFITVPNTVPEERLHFEHTLKAVSDWESETKKSFFDPKALQSTKDLDLYLKCMCLDCKDPDIWKRLTGQHRVEALNYMADSRSATTIWRYDDGTTTVNGKKHKQVMTSEYIYGLMVSLGIPFEAENWNLNRLFKLFDVITTQQGGGQTMTAKQRNDFNRSLNNSRRGGK